MGEQPLIRPPGRRTVRRQRPVRRVNLLGEPGELRMEFRGFADPPHDGGALVEKTALSSTSIGRKRPQLKPHRERRTASRDHATLVRASLRATLTSDARVGAPAYDRPSLRARTRPRSAKFLPRADREIAEHLFVTPKTVEMHLSRTYRSMSSAKPRRRSAAWKFSYSARLATSAITSTSSVTRGGRPAGSVSQRAMLAPPSERADCCFELRDAHAEWVEEAFRAFPPRHHAANAHLLRPR